MKGLPSKSLAHVAGEAVEYVRVGQGPATVVLVNGAGGPLEGWMRVVGPLAAQATVFAYNRPGLGRSAKPTVPQHGRHLVDSLRALLREAGLTPPYVLVGHSLGGLLVHLFARLHPDEVQAVVLLETTSPEDVEVMARHESAVQRGLGRLLARLFPPDPLAETEHVAATVAAVRGAPPFPPVPLVVLTGGRPAMAWATPTAAREARARHQRALVALSPRGRHVIAARSGHFPQLSEPAVVVAAIASVLQPPRAPGEAGMA